MIFREATIDDIKQIQVVRNAVKENTLSNPNLVPDKDVEDYIINRGKGWVCIIENNVVGFSIIDLIDHNVWALFILPTFENKGIGKQLHKLMFDWYFIKTVNTPWLSTTPKTRADQFYRLNGWREVGAYGKNEIKFEMLYEDWVKNKK